jgi:hypothetical protein
MSTKNRVPKTGLLTRLFSGSSEGSLLVAESKSMDRKRRLAEQEGHRHLGLPVKAREHSETETQNNGPEGELQNDMLQHPNLDSPRFDGIDPSLNPLPPLNTAADEVNKQAKEKQKEELNLRLGNMPKFSTAPTPRRP